jgi:N-formylglutamate deformylase
MSDWLEVQRGEAPLIVSMPHTGTDIPPDIEAQLASPWLARKDADWHIEKLYAFAAGIGATLVRTRLSRTVIDVNRDPSGASLYPGQTTTGLCPTETFDGEPLYPPGAEPDEEEIARRRALYFEPYHQALAAEIKRLRARHTRVVLYEAHSIRSTVPRFFDGELPIFNIGTNGGKSCASTLAQRVERICLATGDPTVLDGRFRGGWTTRHYGRPLNYKTRHAKIGGPGVHAIQMELAMRCYLNESTGDWHPERANATQAVLTEVLQDCIDFAKEPI